MAATQRPTAAAAFSEASGPPAWKKLPSWTVVATGDKAAGFDWGPGRQTSSRRCGRTAAGPWFR
jgi:hypothetical protein